MCRDKVRYTKGAQTVHYIVETIVKISMECIPRAKKLFVIRGNRERERERKIKQHNTSHNANAVHGNEW